ncbi:MAG: hypothetical protein WCX27_00455 [Candidatus Paceibacterota bacterium]|jgi:hypothetical protein
MKRFSTVVLVALVLGFFSVSCNKSPKSYIPSAPPLPVPNFTTSSHQWSYSAWGSVPATLTVSFYRYGYPVTIMEVVTLPTNPMIDITPSPDINKMLTVSVDAVTGGSGVTVGVWMGKDGSTWNSVFGNDGSAVFSWIVD